MMRTPQLSTSACVPAGWLFQPIESVAPELLTDIIGFTGAEMGLLMVVLLAVIVTQLLGMRFPRHAPPCS